MSTNTPDRPHTPDRPESVPAPTTSAPPMPAPPMPAPPMPAQPGPAPEVVRGPYLAPIILGLVCLAVAAAAFAQEIADWSVDWGNAGPLGIVVAGAVLVVLGALGLLSSRRRRR